MRKLVMTLTTLSLLVGPAALASPAAAAPPAKERIVLTRDQNLQPSGWSAKGVFTDSGTWTPDHGFFAGAEASPTGKVHLLATETGGDGSTFTMKFEGIFDPQTGAFGGTWSIVSGTADYARLQGRGAWERSVAADGSFAYTCKGRVHFE